MPAEQRIQIKRRANEPSSTSAWQGLLDGELGYIKNTNELYIGNGKGVAPTLISSLSWNRLTNKPTRFTYQVYVDANDPTKLIDKNIQNVESTIGYFAPLTNGLIDLKYLPQGALERLVVVANATARLKLTTANVQLGDTVKETDTGLMYIVVDESKLNSEDGYQVYVAGRAAAVDWTGVENKVNATVSSAGLMSAADKKKLDNTNVAYGTCSTAASTAQKDIVITSQGNWSLQIGSIIVVKFTYTNTAQNPVFKVGSAAAKSVWYNTALISTSNLSYAGYANRPSMYMYDGTQFVWLGWTIDSNSDTKVTQSAVITTAGEYPVLLGYNTETTSVTNTVNKAAAFTYNPNTKILTADTFKGKLTGNADTATKLANKRKINGTDFDGSADITTSKWGTARTISINSAAGTTGTSVDGSANATLVVPTTMTGFTSITSGTLNANTISVNSNNAEENRGLIVTRSGSTGESVRIGVNDSQAQFIYTNDEISSSILFTMANTGIESNNTANANTANVTFTGANGKSTVIADTFKGALTGNADTATKLKTARTISLTGDATGSASFDGSANASITVTVADDSHNHTISNIDNLQSNLDLKYDKAGGPISGHIYMTGSSASSSTANTTQLIFGTSSAQHVAVTSNDKALVINPNSSATTNQIVLYLNKQSVFPGGIKISAGNLDVSGTSTLTGAVTVKDTLTLAKDPVNALEAATKQYVDENSSKGAGVIIHRVKVV